MNGREARGKRKEKKQKREKDVSDDESVISTPEVDSGEEEEPETKDFKMQDAIEQLSEKRASSRIAALQSLNVALASEFMMDAISERKDTLELYLLACLRKGVDEEISLACRTVSLLAVTFGAQGEKVLEPFIPVLDVLVKNAARLPKERAAAAEALAIVLCASISSPAPTSLALSVFSTIFSKQVNQLDPEFLASVITSWTLLASSVDQAKLGGSLTKKTLPLLSPLFEHKAVEVRSAAGEAVGLLYAAHLAAPEPEYDDANQKVQSIPVDELVEQLQALATDSSHRRGKKDKAKQRSLFREIIQTFEEGISPSETMKIGDKKHTFEGWDQLVQLGAIRKVLATGLQLHLAKNPLLCEMFALSLQPDAMDEGGSLKADKLAVSRERARANYHQKQKLRNKKNAFQNLRGEEEA